jgi:hypothetical protein
VLGFLEKKFDMIWLYWCPFPWLCIVGVAFSHSAAEWGPEQEEQTIVENALDNILADCKPM